MVYSASARGVKLTEVESTLEGNCDVQGALGLSDAVPNGFQDITVSFRVKGDAPRETLRTSWRKRRSARLSSTRSAGGFR